MHQPDQVESVNTAPEPFYITTTLPYVNADPHIGFAMEIVRADIVARHKRQYGHDVFFNTGTDEHGVKIYEKAQEAGVEVQQYVDQAARQFKDLLPRLAISEDVRFIRTTDEHHTRAAQEFWRRCDAAGDIYKGTYAVKYCVGCEMEKTESELNEGGRCPEHPTREIEEREEENYFFRFSRYADALLELYERKERFVVPDFRLNEMRQMVEAGLQDFSVSRLKEKMPWGIPVPGDEQHVMYVWFDALVNYIATLGWPDNENDPDGAFRRFWVDGLTIQYAGKDNLRPQAAMWQAMLMSAGIASTDQIVINGFVTSGGQKMSKSLGNVIDPTAFAEEYGTDAVRYYLARELAPFEDSDVTEEKFREAYNANLANGLGNLVARVLKMRTKYEVETELAPREDILAGASERYREGFRLFDLQRASDAVWERISALDAYITEAEPFKVIKTDEAKAREDIAYLVRELYAIAVLLEPFMPETAGEIQRCIKEGCMPEAPLFPRR